MKLKVSLDEAARHFVAAHEEYKLERKLFEEEECENLMDEEERAERRTNGCWNAKQYTEDGATPLPREAWCEACVRREHHLVAYLATREERKAALRTLVRIASLQSETDPTSLPKHSAPTDEYAL